MGDPLARWRMNRAVEANLNGVTETERAEQKEASPRPTYRDLEGLQSGSFSLHNERVERTNRSAFIDAFKHKVTPPFTLTQFLSFAQGPVVSSCRTGTRK